MICDAEFGPRQSVQRAARHLQRGVEVLELGRVDRAVVVRVELLEVGRCAVTSTLVSGPGRHCRFGNNKVTAMDGSRMTV